MEAPRVQYARSGDVSIAYGVVGDGPFDLVFVGGWVLSAFETAWEGPARDSHEVDTAGDGFFARFDGPARAIRCACAITDADEEVGLQVRAGLHTGECEVVDGKVGGIAVHIGARVAAQAAPGEVLVSSTGPRRRVGHPVRARRQRHPQGPAGRVAALRRRAARQRSVTAPPTRCGSTSSSSGAGNPM